MGIYIPLANSVCIIAGCRRLPFYRHTIFNKGIIVGVTPATTRLNTRGQPCLLSSKLFKTSM